MDENLLRRVHNIKGLTFILIMMCFFFSMLITNDAALITFVPFTFTVLNMLGDEIKINYIIPIVMMQTVAANPGSMLTPTGNPQNLYLHGISGLGMIEFILLMLPYTVVSFILLTIWPLLIKNSNINISFLYKSNIDEKGKVVIYIAMFLLCLMSAAHLIDYRITLILVIILTAVTDRRILTKIDYNLLITFIEFFIFTGNMGRIPILNNYIKRAI